MLRTCNKLLWTNSLAFPFLCFPLIASAEPAAEFVNGNWYCYELHETCVIPGTNKHMMNRGHNPPRPGGEPAKVPQPAVNPATAPECSHTATVLGECPKGSIPYGSRDQLMKEQAQRAAGQQVVPQSVQRYIPSGLGGLIPSTTLAPAAPATATASPTEARAAIEGAPAQRTSYTERLPGESEADCEARLRAAQRAMRKGACKNMGAKAVY